MADFTHFSQVLDQSERENKSLSNETSFFILEIYVCESRIMTRSSWLNCALRDDEAVYWVSIGHYEAVAVGN